MGTEHRRLGEILVQRGSIDANELVAALAEQAGAEFVDPRALRIGDDALALTPGETATALQFLPVALEGERAVVVVADPHRPDLDAIRDAIGREMDLLVGAPAALAAAIEKAYLEDPPEESPVARGDDSDDDNDAGVTFESPPRPEATLDLEGPTPDDGADAAAAEDADASLDPEPESPDFDDAPPPRPSPQIDLAGANGASLPDLARGLDPGAGPDAARPLLEGLFAGAFSWGADAIRFHCAPAGIAVQYAIDGSWRSVLRLPDWAGDPVMGGLREVLDEHPRALLSVLDGLRPTVSLPEGRTVGLAVSVVLDGAIERVTLAFRDPARVLKLDSTGLTTDTARRLRQWTSARQGLILVVGSHDSGRTTLLRALAENISGSRRCSLVVRDPVAASGVWSERGESDADGAAAVADALASDPDVLLVDDCDGPMIASAAFTAALRGRLVIAVIGGGDASDALQRLRDRGTSDLLLGDQLLGVVETRLVRLLCGNCWVRGPLDRALARHLSLVIDSIPADVPSAGPGCQLCHHTGYRGRRSVVSRVELDGGVKDGASAQELRQAVTMHRSRTASEVGLTLVMQGLTSLEEIARIVAPRRKTSEAIRKPIAPVPASPPPPVTEDEEAIAEPVAEPAAPPTSPPPDDVAVVELDEVSVDTEATTVDGPGPREPLVSVQAEGWEHDGAAVTVAEVRAPSLEDVGDLDTLDLAELLQLDDPEPGADDRHIVLALDPREELSYALAAAMPEAEFRVVAMRTLQDAARFVHEELPTAIAVAGGWHFDARGAIRAFRDDLASAFVPVIVISDDDEHNDELLAAGADAIVAGGLADEELEGALRAVLRRLT